MHRSSQLARVLVASREAGRGEGYSCILIGGRGGGGSYRSRGRRLRGKSRSHSAGGAAGCMRHGASGGSARRHPSHAPMPTPPLACGCAQAVSPIGDQSLYSCPLARPRFGGHQSCGRIGRRLRRDRHVSAAAPPAPSSTPARACIQAARTGVECGARSELLSAQAHSACGASDLAGSAHTHPRGDLVGIWGSRADGWMRH